MNNTDYGYHIHSTLIHKDSIPRKTAAKQSVWVNCDIFTCGKPV